MGRGGTVAENKSNVQNVKFCFNCNFFIITTKNYLPCSDGFELGLLECMYIENGKLMRSISMAGN